MRVLLTEEELDKGVRRLATEIARDYGDKALTIIGVMTGSLVLLADLIRLLEMPLRVGVVQASSYRGSASRGPVVVNSDLMPDIAKRDVLLLDDIYDTGHTLVEVFELMDAMGPRSIRSAVLLRKRGRQQVAFSPDYVVFEIPDEFVVGYGLDYHDAYRNLSYVAALDSEELAGESA